MIVREYIKLQQERKKLIRRKKLQFIRCCLRSDTISQIKTNNNHPKEINKIKIYLFQKKIYGNLVERSVVFRKAGP